MNDKPESHNTTLLVSMHPDLKNHIRAGAERDYITMAEVIRKLIIADMRKNP